MNVVLAESSRDAVLAAVSLARRLPGGAELAFATRERLDAALKTPRHRDRKEPYRMIVLGPDLARDRHEEIARTLRDDPAERIDWIDANEWEGPGDLTRGGGVWVNRPVTHHPFAAIDAAAAALSLADDPFTADLIRIAEGDSGELSRVWRDALDVLADRPLELPASVKPLLHGILAEIAPADRLEGDAMGADIDDMVEKSRLTLLAGKETGPEARKKTVLLVLPVAGRVPLGRLAEAALAKSGAEIALILFDRSDLAVISGKRHGASPPADVKPAMNALLALPFVKRDRLCPGTAVLRLEAAPSDAMHRLVAALS